MEFKNFLNLQERRFTIVDRGGYSDYPIYLNPSIGDVQLLSQTTRQIRGLTKGQFVFIWDSNETSHQYASKELEKFDPELKDMPTDICFYLNIANKVPLELDLEYSSFTGQSTSTKNGIIHLRRLLSYPNFQGIVPAITNVEEIQRSDSWNHRYVNTNRNKEPELPQKSTTSSIDAWQKTGKIKPYQWKNGLHRLGD